MNKEACDDLTPKVRELIIPTRWVRTNKAENPVSGPFKSESRFVAQGFKDKSLGR